jgi:protein involved in polysaccharide export with SLBB domain
MKTVSPLSQLVRAGLTCLVALLLGLPATLQASTLRAGDKVEIRLGGVPTEEIMAVSAVYTIDAEGFINLPHIGKIKAAGLQQHQLQQNIENRYRSEEIYTRPTITINQQMGERFVNVDGEVRVRTRVPYTPDMTLLSAINAAGGVNEFADQKRVQLSRDGNSEVYDLRRLRRDPNLDVKVQPGDNIFVPRSFW